MADDGLVPGCIAIPIVVIVCGSFLIEVVYKEIVVPVAPIFLTLLLLAAVGLVVSNLRRERVERDRFASLRKVLSQTDGYEPVHVNPALSAASVEWQESVIRNIDWYSVMKFARETADGVIYTTVSSTQETATVLVVLNGHQLADLKYSVQAHSRDTHQPIPLAVYVVRDWMRRRYLPALLAKKASRDREIEELASARKATLEAEGQKLQEYRRKYLS